MEVIFIDSELLYVFFCIPWKVHYVMAIEKLYMKFIQCDYIIYNIVVLALYRCHRLYLITWHLRNPKSCKICFVTTFYR